MATHVKLIINDVQFYVGSQDIDKEQKKWNEKVAQVRIYVEHRIGGIKIFRMLKNRCRLKIKEQNEIIRIV